MAKRISFIFLVIIMILSFVFINEAHAYTRVKGYTKKNGTYVMPHYKTSPDSTRWNNWSTKGNYNPFSGKKGYTSPFKTFKTYRLKW